MPDGRAALRGGLLLAPALVALALASILSNEDAAALLRTAALIFLAVAAFEGAANRRDSADGLGAGGTGSSMDQGDQPQTRRLLKLLSFIGTSTPTLASAAEEGGGEILDGWLELVGRRLEGAVGCSVGAMVLREEWEMDEVDLVPYCEVVSSAGSPQCVLPSTARIPIKAGIAWDVGQTVGARSIFLAPLSIGDHRFWVCLTLIEHIEDVLLQPITNAMVAPVTFFALIWLREPGRSPTDPQRQGDWLR